MFQCIIRASSSHRHRRFVGRVGDPETRGCARNELVATKIHQKKAVYKNKLHRRVFRKKRL